MSFTLFRLWFQYLDTYISQFSQAVGAKSTGNLTCLKPREISIMLILKCHVVTLFVSFLYVIDLFYWNKDNHSISLLCVESGWADWWALIQLLLIKLTLKGQVYWLKKIACKNILKWKNKYHVLSITVLTALYDRAKQCIMATTYTTTHMNKTVNGRYFQQNQCLNITKKCSTQHA